MEAKEYAPVLISLNIGTDMRRAVERSAACGNIASLKVLKEERSKNRVLPLTNAVFAQYLMPMF